ncbi:hypothetical protein [Rhizobium sp. BK176]|uniref:hypothetical protein n=1 Tax=Rhizobium sp. BK176 TaxID=2587071 RepID=UPI00216A9C58|nr:hypothetical protein [Rhizobium sp. BK176]MCS4089134.1 hypothetical protein [Rhizobium sp. BK176]
MEVDGHACTRATWDGQGPVVFPPNQSVKLLAPIHGMEFACFEALGKVLRGIGYLVTDLRHVVARVNDPYVAMALLADRTVERLKDEIIIIRRFPDGTHGDGIWQLDPSVFDFIRRAKLIHLVKNRRLGNSSRQSFGWGPRSFDTLSGCHIDWLARYMEELRHPNIRSHKFNPWPPIQTNPPVLTQIMPAALPLVMEPLQRPPVEVHSKVVSFSAPTAKRKRAPVEAVSYRIGDPFGSSFVVALDDDGNPITMVEVTQEYVRAAPKQMPTNVLRLPQGCADHELRKIMMIERIKHRRRAQENMNSRRHS